MSPAAFEDIRTLLRAGQTEKALDLARTLLAQDVERSTEEAIQLQLLRAEAAAGYGREQSKHSDEEFEAIQQAAQLAQGALPTEHPQRIRALRLLGTALANRGRSAEALDLLAEVVALGRQTGRPSILALEEYRDALRSLGRRQEAIGIAIECVDVWGPSSTKTAALVAMFFVAQCYVEAELWAEAELAIENLRRRVPESLKVSQLTKELDELDVKVKEKIRTP